jgi:hypothetical protein
MGQGRPASAGDDGLERHPFGAPGPGAMFELRGYRRFRHPRLDMGQKLVEEVDPQASRSFHQPKFFFVLDQAKIRDEGCGERLEETPASARQGFAVVFEVCNRGRFGIEGAVSGSTGGQPLASFLACGPGGNHYPCCLGFLLCLGDVPAIGEHDRAGRGDGKEGVGPGKTAQVAYVREVGHQQAGDALLFHLPAQAAQPGCVIHLLRYIRCLPQLTQASTLRVHGKASKSPCSWS